MLRLRARYYTERKLWGETERNRGKKIVIRKCRGKNVVSIKGKKFNQIYTVEFSAKYEGYAYCI